MRTCPTCGRLITDATTQSCPNCGAPLAEYPAPSEQVQPVPPAYGAPPSQSPYGPSYGPNYGPGYGSGYGGQAPMSQPMSQPMSPYPPAAPSGPTYGQPSQQPMYVPGGQPQPPTQPPYGPAYGQPQAPYGPAYGAPSGYPGAYRPGADWQPGKQSSRTPWGRIIAGVAGALVVIAIVVSVYNQSRPQQPLSTAQVNATATSNAITTLLADPLTSNAHGWANDLPHCYFAQDGYHNGGGYVCYAPVDGQTDVTESVTTQQVSGPTTHGYGMVMRMVDVHNFYEFDIDSDGKWVFFKDVGGTVTRLHDYTADPVIKSGLNVENTLSVTASGSTFDCYVNGQKVGTIQDSSIPEGKLGLSASDGINVVFTNYLARV